jgi:hypothetical protein
MTDPFARIMKQSDGGYAPSYNVQITTDKANSMIVGAGVSQSASDYEELVPALERIEDNLGELPNQVVADGGFTSRSNIIEMNNRGVDFIGSLLEGINQSAGQLKRRGVDKEKLFGSKASKNLIDFTHPRDLWSIISTEWDAFKNIFGKDKQYWNSRLGLIANIRNPLAHNRDELVNDYERQIAEGYCKEILALKLPI